MIHLKVGFSNSIIQQIYNWGKHLIVERVQKYTKKMSIPSSHERNSSFPDN